MARARRTDLPGGIHHVMNRGVNRGLVFFADVDRREFGERLAHVHDEFDVETLAYCLMPNHYHLLLRTPEGGLSAAMQHLGQVYTRHTNDRIGRDGPLFRGRFLSVRVTTDDYLTWVTRYIHRNALDLPGVASPASYRWSSYRTYLGERPCPPFVNTDVVLAMFDFDRHRFAGFTDEDACAAQHPAPDGEIGLAAFDEIVGFAIGHDALSVGDEQAHNARWLERAITLLVLDRSDDPTLRAELVRRCHFPSPAARRMAIMRARRRLAQDSTIQRVLATVEHLLPHHRSPA